MESFNRGSFPFDLVGLGGCFDHLHEGHQQLLKTAFLMGKKVAIALTTEKLQINKTHRESIQSYSTRYEKLSNFIEKILNVPKEDYSIIPLEDPFGSAITEENLQAHVSSMETYPVALKINEIRISKGLKPLHLIIIPLIVDADGKKVSSSTIRENYATHSK